MPTPYTPPPITRAGKDAPLTHDEMDQNALNSHAGKAEKHDLEILTDRVTAAEGELSNKAEVDHTHTADQIPVATGSSTSVQDALSDLDAEQQSLDTRVTSAEADLVALKDQALRDKGTFPTPEALNAAYPTAQEGDRAFVDSTDSAWYYSDDAWIDSGKKGAVESVNGQTGVVSLSATDVGAAEASDLATLAQRVDEVVLALASTGLVNERVESFDLTRIDASTLGVGEIAQLFFNDDLTGASHFNAQVIDLNAVLSLADGLYLKHVHISRDGLIEFLDQRDAESPDRAALGVVYLQVVGGVVTMPADLPPVARPAMAGISAFERAKLGLSLSLTLTPNPDLGLSCSAGNASGESVNWPDRNAIHVRPLPAQNPLPMRRIHAGLASQTAVPATSLALDPAQYWNGSALVAVGGGSGRSTVQRLLWSPGAGFSIQYGEVVYPTLPVAANAMSIAPFASVFPGAEGVELARMAVSHTAVNLQDPSQCVLRFGAGLGGGGSSQGTTSHDSLTDLLGTPGQLNHIDNDLLAKLQTLGADVQEFTFSGTWTKPAGAMFVCILLIGAGAGGACGEKRATGTSKGGDSGGGGGITFWIVPADWLTATASVVIGPPGVGAPGRTDEGGQVLGTRGGDVVFTGGLRLRARGGTAQITDSNGDEGFGTHLGFSGQVGAGSFGWDTPYAQRQRNYTGCICGNPGGGISAADSLLNPPVSQVGAGAGFVVGAFGDDGPSGPFPSALFRLGGRGGLGGYAALVDSGTDGTAGLNYGAGGGGGGATRNGERSGSGGNGAYGLALIMTLRG